MTKAGICLAWVQAPRPRIRPLAVRQCFRCWQRGEDRVEIRLTGSREPPRAQRVVAPPRTQHRTGPQRSEYRGRRRRPPPKSTQRRELKRWFGGDGSLTNPHPKHLRVAFATKRAGARPASIAPARGRFGGIERPRRLAPLAGRKQRSCSCAPSSQEPAGAAYCRGARRRRHVLPRPALVLASRLAHGLGTPQAPFLQAHDGARSILGRLQAVNTPIGFFAPAIDDARGSTGPGPTLTATKSPNYTPPSLRSPRRACRRRAPLRRRCRR